MTVPSLSGVPCTRCGVPALRVEVRTEWTVRKPGTYSLAGVQPKAAATTVEWPWAVCDSCGAQCRGKRADASGGN